MLFAIPLAGLNLTWPLFGAIPPILKVPVVLGAAAAKSHVVTVAVSAIRQEGL